MKELALYVAAGIVYIALGLAVPELLLSWVEGAAFLLVAVWVLPALARGVRLYPLRSTGRFRRSGRLR
jgi:hypothetical protein